MGGEARGGLAPRPALRLLVAAASFGCAACGDPIVGEWAVVEATGAFAEQDEDLFDDAGCPDHVFVFYDADGAFSDTFRLDLYARYEGSHCSTWGGRCNPGKVPTSAEVAALDEGVYEFAFEHARCSDDSQPCGHNGYTCELTDAGPFQAARLRCAGTSQEGGIVMEEGRVRGCD